MFLNEVNFGTLARKVLEAFKIFDDYGYLPLIQKCRNAIVTEGNWCEYYIVLVQFLDAWGACGRTLMKWRKWEMHTNLFPVLQKMTGIRDQFPQDIDNFTGGQLNLVQTVSQNLADVTGPVIASKILHLFFPDIFMPLDHALAREILGKDVTSEDFGNPYKLFLQRVIKLMSLEPISRSLSNTKEMYHRPKTYIADKVFWIMADRDEGPFVKYCDTCQDYVFRGNLSFADGIRVKASKSGGEFEHLYHEISHGLQSVKYDPYFLAKWKFPQ